MPSPSAAPPRRWRAWRPPRQLRRSFPASSVTSAAGARAGSVAPTGGPGSIAGCRRLCADRQPMPPQPSGCYSSHLRCRVRAGSPRRGWVQERDPVVHGQPFNGGTAFIFTLDPDLALFEASAILQIDDELTILHEQGLPGDTGHVLLLAAKHDDLGGKTRT